MVEGPNFTGRIEWPILTEEEILIRAREAVIATERPNPFDHEEIGKIRAGLVDHWFGIRCAEKALRDLAKPLSEIIPVDPDLIEARKVAAEAKNYAGDQFGRDILAGQHDGHPIVIAALAAIKRGRELEREARSE